MALVLGTNCGFVTSAPVDDPAGSSHAGRDYNVTGIKDTSPATAVKVTEIGWWCDNATEESNFEVGIYTHDAIGNLPKNLIAGYSQTNAKGTTAGWKRVTGLNITIEPNTIYWIVYQLDDTATATNGNYSASIGARFVFGNNETTLLNPWEDTGFTNDYILSNYAVWEAGAAGATAPVQLNIGDAWKDASGAIKINIGDAWKDVTGVQMNIGDAWKTVF